VSDLCKCFCSNFRCNRKNWPSRNWTFILLFEVRYKKNL